MYRYGTRLPICPLDTTSRPILPPSRTLRLGGSNEQVAYGGHLGAVGADRCGWAEEPNSPNSSSKHRRAGTAFPLANGEHRCTSSALTVGEHGGAGTAITLEIESSPV